jgi:hypothetical protein
VKTNPRVTRRSVAVGQTSRDIRAPEDRRENKELVDIVLTGTCRPRLWSIFL